MNDQMKPKPSFLPRLGKAFVNLLRFLVILVIGAAIVAMLYFGLPYIYQRFILPVETNTARVIEVEAKQAAEMDGLSTQVTDLKTRLAALESRQTQYAQSITEMQGQMQTVESAIESNDAALKQIEALQTSLDALTNAVDEHEKLLTGKNSALSDLQNQVTLSRTIELLSRARLYLSQSNFGLAKQDVQAARDQLLDLQEKAPERNISALSGTINRLDMALSNLPAFPVVAVDDLDIAWQLLINGLPEAPLATPMPDPVIQTPEVTVTMTATP